MERRAGRKIPPCIIDLESFSAVHGALWKHVVSANIIQDIFVAEDDFKAMENIYSDLVTMHTQLRSLLETFNRESRKIRGKYAKTLVELNHWDFKRILVRRFKGNAPKIAVDEHTRPKIENAVQEIVENVGKLRTTFKSDIKHHGKYLKECRASEVTAAVDEIKAKYKSKDVVARTLYKMKLELGHYSYVYSALHRYPHLAPPGLGKTFTKDKIRKAIQSQEKALSASR